MNDKNIIDGIDLWNLFLFSIFILWFNSMFYFNDALVFNNLFLYFLAPFSMIPINIHYCKQKNSFITKLSLSDMKLIGPLLCKPQFLALLVYFISISVSTSIYPSFSIDWLFFMLKLSLSNFLFVFVVIKLFINIQNFINLFFGICAVCLSISAILNLIVYFNSLIDISYFSEIRMVSEIGHGIDHAANSAGLVYALFFVSSSYLILKSSSLYLKSIFCACSAVLLFALILSHSRGPMAGVVCALIVSIILAEGRVRVIQGGLLLSFISVFLFFRRIAQIAIQRLDNNRFEIWGIFIKHCKTRLFFGYGERHKFEEVIKNGEIIYHPHNMLLGAQILGGLFASMSFLIISIYGIFYTYKYFTKFDNLLPLMLLIVTLVAGLVDFRIEVLGAGWSWIVFLLPVSLSIAASRFCYPP